MILFENDVKSLFPKDFNINSLKVVEFRRNSFSLFAKNEYRGEYKEIDFLKKKVELKLKKKFETNETDLLADIPREEEAKGISAIKKQELMNLCKVMPSSRVKFYEDLKEVDETEDLDEEAPAL